MNTTDMANNNTSSLAKDDGNFDFLFEGVLTTAVSVVGLGCNVLAVIVLTRPKMRGSSFHTLLIALSLVDTLYLLTSTMIFGLPMLSVWYVKTIYVNVAPPTYAAAHMGRVGSVYLTMSVTIERYFAIVHPLKHVGWKRFLIPLSMAFTVCFNLPRFFELRYSHQEEDVIMTEFRKDPNYVTYYIFWAKFVLVEMIPYVTIIVLNSSIMYKIYKSSSFQKKYCVQRTLHQRPKSPSECRKSSHRFSSHRRGRFTLHRDAKDISKSTDDAVTLSTNNQLGSDRGEERPQAKPNKENNLVAVLIGISILFIVCQSVKILPDVYEVIYCRILPDERDGKRCDITTFIERTVSVSHFLLAINSSANFIVYTWRGVKFRAELMQLLRLFNCNKCFSRQVREPESSTLTSSVPMTTSSNSGKGRNVIVSNSLKRRISGDDIIVETAASRNEHSERETAV